MSKSNFFTVRDTTDLAEEAFFLSRVTAQDAIS